MPTAPPIGISDADRPWAKPTTEEVLHVVGILKRGRVPLEASPETMKQAASYLARQGVYVSGEVLHMAARSYFNGLRKYPS
jgi:hypothetical protein